jgi:hypothetical protein
VAAGNGKRPDIYEANRRYREEQEQRDDSTEDPMPGWPEPLGEAAFRGLAGTVVETIAPYSEADPAAILLHFLVIAGALVGRRRYMPIEGNRHCGNLFLLIVGDTSSGRKGTAYGQVRRIMAEAFPEFMRKNVAMGLASGEGLINAVRDATQEDPGVIDKRLLCVETEFASVLRALDRDGNTLSARLRQAFDSGDFRTMTKATPLIASDAHVALIGHITPSELRVRLQKTEISNGLLNRFCLACSRRSKRRPHGGVVPEREVYDLGVVIREMLNASMMAPVEMARDAEANALWETLYDELTDGYAGELGEVLSRATAQVVRLSIIYATLDRETSIRVPHLEAAMAVWHYVVQSVEYLFTTLNQVDRRADELLETIRGAGKPGITRNTLRDAIGHRVTSAEMEQALRSLEARALASRIFAKTKGRPVETWAVRELSEK